MEILGMHVSKEIEPEPFIYVTRGAFNSSSVREMLPNYSAHVLQLSSTFNLFSSLKGLQGQVLRIVANRSLRLFRYREYKDCAR